MKLKHKLILDGILLLLLILLMNYSLTGGLLHELLGAAILLGFIVHVAVNRKYYSAMARAWRSGTISTRGKAIFATDIILPIAAVVMAISSLAVSQELFPGIAGLFSSDLWVPVHIVCAVLLLICVFAHVCLHIKMFNRIIEQATENPGVMMMRRAGLSIMALMFAVLVVRSSFSNMVSAASQLPAGSSNADEIDGFDNRQDNELIIKEYDQDDQNGYEIEIEPEPEQTVSLEEYLGTLFCSGCGRHCSLLSPRCGKGENQAAQAAAEYYETYSGQSV